VFKTGAKGAADVGIFLYEEMRSSGLFNADVLWNPRQPLLRTASQETKENDSLEKALKTMAELERAVPNHAEAGRTIKNWEALRSMTKRQGAATGGGTAAAGGDFRSQLSSDDKARRQEAMNRIIRTQQDAEEVMQLRRPGPQGDAQRQGAVAEEGRHPTAASTSSPRPAPPTRRPRRSTSTTSWWRCA